jgi:hypothetical protein
MSKQTTETKTAKPSKTKLTRETAIRVLKRANRPLTIAELTAKVLADPKVKAAAVPKSTVSAQINFELAEAEPWIVRVERGVYRHADTAYVIGISTDAGNE